MLDPLMLKIESYKQVKWIFIFAWVPIKLYVAYILIENLEYGLYIVIGYILFSLENISGLLLINSQESNHHFSTLYNKLDKKTPNENQELNELQSKIDEIELRLNDVETNIEDDNF